MANPQATALTYTVNASNYDVTMTSPASTYSGAQVAGTLTAGTLVAAFMDLEGHQRSFIPPAGAVASQWTGATAAAAGTGIVVGQLYGSSTPASVVFPAVVSATVQNDSAGNPTGPVKLVLQPGTGDLFNASSVMTYLLDQNAIVLTVTGTF